MAKVKPDTTNPDNVDTKSVDKKIALGQVLTLCFGCVMATWAISTQVQNYRLTNITTRLKSQETRMLSMIENNATQIATQATRDNQQDLLAQRIGTLLEAHIDHP